MHRILSAYNHLIDSIPESVKVILTPLALFISGVLAPCALLWFIQSLA